MATALQQPPQPKTTPAPLSNPSPLSLGILENLARFEVLNVKQLCLLMYGEIDDTHEGSLRRSLRILKGKGFIHTCAYCPDGYNERKLPLAAWLSEEGARFAEYRWTGTYPKYHGKERSRYTIDHDIKRADTHEAIFKLCEEQGFTLGWRKTDLSHFVKPDDIFEITKEKTARFFLEEENKKKNLKEMYEKLKAYVEMRGSDKCKEHWGFKYFNVIIPMRNKEAAMSVLTHFAGDCNCQDFVNKRLHKNAPFKLQSDTLWFTTHDMITTQTTDKIFLTFDGKERSLLDIIR